MDQIQKAVYYCSVSKGGRILYSYIGVGDDEIENLAVLCLEKTPPYHKWYFQTMAKKTFGFLMEEGYVYFAITDEGLGNVEVLRFLEQLKDEFRKVARKGSGRSMSNLNSLCVQEQLVPVIRHLITSLEHVSGWPADTPPQHGGNNANGQIEGSGSSTRAPLLAKASRQDKKKMKDHAIAMRGIELEEHRKSTERAKVDSGVTDSNNQGAGVLPPPMVQKEFGLVRTRSGSQNFHRRWCRQVRIVLAIDAAVCVVLFVIWLVICQGTKCLR
ncbi:PREDICTED: phytolongin Phyl1.1-like [Nicotiana attenuata]|uniref:Phytolongin phyl1.1 n=1 Tax=Nicotiana attenuata TaxID=49451 RepID=A0A314LBT3_NICAT|nr:PREDICTED: phytolongin Phyl1.1-like [Nicotiana attenuata]OIT38509.1 phytolongin phyl1.1 [Nicotiana attenuata]